MKTIPASLPDVVTIEPRIFEDSRGWFMEAFNEATFKAAGLPWEFIQDNQSRSRAGVLRGMHYQLGNPQGKLVRVLTGSIFDVVVDLRPGSPAYGKWEGFELSAENRRQLWIPENFAHGFLVLSDSADVLYKVTSAYDPKTERTLLWNDSHVGIEWPGTITPILSDKDAAGKSWAEADLPVTK